MAREFPVLDITTVEAALPNSPVLIFVPATLEMERQTAVLMLNEYTPRVCFSMSVRSSKNILLCFTSQGDSRG